MLFGGDVPGLMGLGLEGREDVGDVEADPW